MTDAAIHDFCLPGLDGSNLCLADHAGRVLLVVNTASECGFTPQYAGLERLWQAYADRGLTVIGCPCDQFGHQEPRDEAGIRRFCQTHYGVTFPMSARIEVNGAHAHPLFRHLKQAAPGVLGSRAIKWNFTKFLVDREGREVLRYSPSTPPDRLVADIERLL